MGQFGNQPDFATNDIKEIATVTNNINQTTFLNGSIIYIGDNTTLGSDGCMVVIPAGVRAPNGGLPTAAQSVAFYGLQAGGFLPVTVDYVLASNASNTTTVQKLIAAK
jgi:hypothetical protein